MKTPPLLLPLVLAATPLVAAPVFTVRQLPAGFDAPTLGGSGGPRIMSPIAADFMGNGRLQWYQGGNVISRFPEGGNLILPAIKLPQTPFATAVPLAAAACDVDRDGDMDIIRINEWNGNAFKYTIQVFLNNGTGTFTAGFREDWTNDMPYNEGSHHLNIVPGDFNRDGAVDLAITETYSFLRTETNPNRYDGKLYIRWNNGTGGFSSMSTLQGNGLPSYCRISAADYDRDGDPDIHCSVYNTFGPDLLTNSAASGWNKERSLLFTNSGTGTFTVGNNFPSIMPRGFVDLNGDGWTDLADVSRKAINKGDGTFASVENLTQYDGAWSQGALAIFADIDRDNLPDVVYPDGKLVKYNHNSGDIVHFSPNTLATLPVDVDSVGVADADGDGDPDIFVSMENGTFAFLENRETHTVPGASLAGSLSLNGVTSLRAADFDLDGHEDVLAVTPSQKSLWIIPALETGLPGAPSARLTQGQTPHSAVVADFDRDGKPDVAYTLPAAGTVRLVRNTGASPAAWTDTAIASSLPGVSLLATGEYGTPDGRPDLFTGSATTGQIRGLYQSGNSWSGQTLLTSASPAPLAIAAGQSSTAPGDEMAYFSSNASSLSLRGFQLSGGWNALGGAGVSQTSLGSYAAKVIWADVTGDNVKEAVYINGIGNLAAWIPASNSSLVLGNSPSGIGDIAAADWDQDGRTDILAATGTGLTVFHYQRINQKWTGSIIHTAASGGYKSVAILDMDHDRWPDAVAADSATGRVDYFYNRPNNLRADLSALPPAVELVSGSTADLFQFPLSSNGRPAESGGLVDPGLGVNRCRLLFKKAVSGPGGTWTPGGLLPLNTLNQLVKSVSLVANGATVCSRITDDLLVDGSLFMDYNAAGNSMASIAPGATVPHGLRMSLPAAGTWQDTPRFFVVLQEIRANLISEGPLGATSGASTLLTDNRPVLVSISRDYTALESWRLKNFASAESIGKGANHADYDGDGVCTLVEYITGTNPVAGESAINAARGLTVLPPATPQSPVKLRLVLANSILNDPKVQITIQFSANLNSWNTCANFASGSWSKDANPQASQTDNGTATTYVFTPPVFQGIRGYFFRLKVEELP